MLYVCELMRLSPLLGHTSHYYEEYTRAYSQDLSQHAPKRRFRLIVF